MAMPVQQVKVPEALLTRLASVGFPQGRLGTKVENGKHFIDRGALPQAHPKLTPDVMARLNQALRWGLLFTPSPDVCKGVFPPSQPMLPTDPDTYATAPEGVTLAHFLTAAPEVELHLRGMEEFVPERRAENLAAVRLLQGLGMDVDFHAPFIHIFGRETFFNIALRLLHAPYDTLGKSDPNAKFGIGEAGMDLYQSMVDFAAEAQIGLFSFHATGAAKPFFTATDFAAFAGKVRQVVDYASARNVEIAVETGGFSEDQHFELYLRAGAGILLDGVHYGVGVGGVKRNVLALYERARKGGVPIPLIHIGQSIDNGDSHTPLHVIQADLPDGKILDNFGLPQLLQIIAAEPRADQPRVRLEQGPNSFESIVWMAQTLGIIP